mmetsp:Transcript_40081/g.72020  ORF Transcript_40081/g.72020 Transcript_40081/m.72020 type:complete len:132 (-) Transcript_40081:849-1244(-)
MPILFNILKVTPGPLKLISPLPPALLAGSHQIYHQIQGSHHVIQVGADSLCHSLDLLAHSYDRPFATAILEASKPLQIELVLHTQFFEITDLQDMNKSIAIDAPVLEEVTNVAKILISQELQKGIGIHGLH